MAIDSFAGPPVEVSVACSSFSEQFKLLRLRRAGKQVVISSGLHCTTASVSYWETGRRLPSAPMLGKVIEVLVRLGATRHEVDNLCTAWVNERFHRYTIDRAPRRFAGQLSRAR